MSTSIKWKNYNADSYTAAHDGFNLLVFGKSNEFGDPLDGWHVSVHGHGWEHEHDLDGTLEDAQQAAERLVGQLERAP